MTARFLLPVQDEIFALLMEIRCGLEPALRRQYPEFQGKPYPLGRCMEITNAVRDALAERLRKPQCRAERALRAFQDQGGVIRPVWGALRGCYFQNATQIGTLYVDVSNDTVTPTKPKVEILPMAESGLEPIRDLPHFRQIACAYWKAEIFCNLIIPSLAPLMPMISRTATGHVALQAADHYMVALAMRDQFRGAEEWLMQGPPPPPSAMRAISAFVPPDLLPPAGQDARAAAVEACRAARNAGHYKNMDWRDERLKDFNRIIEQASLQAA